MGNQPLKALLAPAAGLFVLCLATTTAHAQTSGTITGTVEVSITLEAGCEVNGSSGPADVDFGAINFGEHSTLFLEATAQAQFDQTAISVLCSPGTEPQFTVRGGLHDDYSGSTAHYAMKHSSDSHYVPYNLYRDSGSSNAVEPNASYPLDGDPDGIIPQNITLYGKAYGQGGLTAGAYNDTLTLALEF